MNNQVVGSRIIFLNKVGSTNDYAKNLIETGKPPEGTVIYSKFQTSGKGMDKNIWESEPGKNLLLSIILYPSFLLPENQFELNKVISLATYDLVSEKLQDKNVKIKWPNDIYVGGKKIAGMLVKNTVQGNNLIDSIIGIGININQENFSPEIPNPTSLKLESGKVFPVKNILDDLVRKFEIRYRQLKNGLTKKIGIEYLNTLYNYQTKAKYLVDEQAVEGIITGVTKFGQLVMIINGIQKEFDIKEIKFAF